MMRISKSFQKTLEKDLDRYKRNRLTKVIEIGFDDREWKFWKDILVVGDAYVSTNIDRQLDNLLNI